MTSFGATVTTVSDTNVNFAVSVISFTNALGDMSYHVFQGVYADGKKATAGLRVWVNRFLYGTWGVREIPDDDEAAAQAWIDECQHRGVNCYVNNTSGGLQDYLATGAGQNYAEAHDYGYVKDSNQWGTNPRMWFVDDEPDLEEGTVELNFCNTGLNIPCGSGHTAGILGLHLLETGETLRALNPSAPTTINLDGNFKPDGWYAYGQFADVMMMDSYYEGEQAYQNWDRPAGKAIYDKATAIYAAAIATTTAAEPNPMHMILNSIELKDGATGNIWPFPSPASKRIQAYYALAGGAKGMAYWWFKAGYPYNGLAAGTAAANALWKEIGVVGNEIKTAQPLLVISHPVTMPVNPSTNVWARALAVDTNALILIVVNDNYKIDVAGIHLTNVPNAYVTNTLPSWLVDIDSTTAFEISAAGTKDVAATLSGSQFVVSLGTLTVTRMIVITTDPQLRSTIQARYDSLVKSHICGLAPELCDPPAPCVKNAGAEDGFALNGGSYIANNWAEFEGIYGTNVTGYDEITGTNVHGGSHSQRIRVWGSGGVSGGCYQQIGATDGSNYTVAAWIKAFDTSSKCYLGVDPTGGTSAGGGSVVWSSVQTNVSWAQKSLNVTASGGSGRMTVFYKVVSSDSSKRNGYFDDATPFCAAGPSITTQPASTNLCPGGTVTFNVAATGQGTLTYQWQKDGVSIFDGGHYSGAATTTLVVTNVDSGDAADYSAEVTDVNGTTNSSAATLTVKTATGFTQHPIPVSVCSGADIQFSVVAVGDGTITYQWQTNGVNISNNSHYSGCTTATMTVSNVVNGDQVNYRCVATAGCGNATSFQAAMTIATNCAPNNMTNADFEGSDTGGLADGWTSYQRSPNPTTVWSIQTASPAEGLQYQQILNTSSTGGAGIRQDVTGTVVGCSYTVSGWMRGNSGSATCTVKVSPTASTSWATAIDLNPPQTTNGSVWVAFSGTVTATSTNMTVWLDGQTTGSGLNKAECFDGVTVTCGSTPPPPVITGQPSAQNVCAGANASFTVTATGSGLSYQWQTNNVNINNGSHYSGCTSATMWVTNVGSADAVNYRCVVSNAGGSTNSSNAALTLKAATTITQQPVARNICTGVTTNFTVAATGDGAVTYQWQTNGVNISNNSKYAGCTTTTLWVTNAQSADQVNYRCVATAGCGSVNSSTAALTLKTATSITQQPVTRQVSSGGKTNFTVAATGDGTLTYQWQTNSVNISNNNKYAGCTTATLWVTNCVSADAVNYRCVVTGGCGSANSSTATLIVCNAATLLNPSFELSNISGVATNWTGYQRSPNPTTVWTIQTASPPAGTGTNYQQIANTTSTGGGGVRQDIKNCVIGATYRVAGWYRGNSGLYSTCTVKVSPTASTSWATAINLSPAQTYTGNTWTNFSGTVTATGTNMTLWLDGQTSGTAENKAECFDGVTVTCSP